MERNLVTVRRSRVRLNKNQSVMITIPKAFSEENNLSPGDILRICRPAGKDDTLVIVAEKGEPAPTDR